jgi:hypothetical protein
MLLGAATLPGPSIPSASFQDALAQGTLEPGEAAEWNRAVRFPSRLLVWGVLPAAALVVGGLAGSIERRRGVYLAPLSFTIIWIAIVWDSWPAMNDVPFGVLYASVTVLAAVLSSRFVSRRKEPVLS